MIWKIQLIQKLKILEQKLEKIKRYLSRIDYEYQSDLKIIKKINFEKYKRYETLKDLIKRTSNSKSCKLCWKDGLQCLVLNLHKIKLAIFKNLEILKIKI